MKRQRRLAAIVRRRKQALVIAAVVAAIGGLFIWRSFAITPQATGSADLNGDGKVNIQDLALLLINFGKTATASKGDINGDGKVTIQDLALLLVAFGKPVGGGGGGNAAPGISKGMVEDNNGEIAQDAADMQTLGVTWNRGWMTCGEGQGLTGMTNTLKAKGVVFLPTYNCDINTSINTYKSTLAADVKVLAPLGVHVWEIGNEMDGGWTQENNYCNNNSTPGQMDCAEKAYLPFLQAAYETIHANDPQGVVMYGGLSSYDVNVGPWLNAMYNSQAWQWMDAMGYHPYGNSVDESMGSMDVLKQYMSKNAIWASKPIWITEYGCWSSGLGANQNSPCSPQNEAGKAAYITGMLDRLKAWNKGTPFEIRTPICWYILHESGSTPGYGLTEIGGNRTYFPAFDAYKSYHF